MDEELDGLLPQELQAPERRIEAIPPGHRAASHFYSAEAVVDLMLARPGLYLKEYAQIIGRSPVWLRTIMNTDSFRAQYHAKAGRVVDPLIQEEVKNRFDTMLKRSLEVLQEKMERPAQDIPDNLVLKAIELGAKANSVGGFSSAPPAPAPTLSAEERLAKLANGLTSIGAKLAGEVIDVQSRDVTQKAPPAHSASAVNQAARA
jgi:hypothetical protein